MILSAIKPVIRKEKQNDSFATAIIQESQSAQGTGTVRRIEQKSSCTYVYLDKTTVALTNQSSTIKYFKKFLLICYEAPIFSLGNRIQFQGEISLFPSATNPGQFDQRQYFRQKNIQFQFIIPSNQNIQIQDSAQNLIFVNIQNLYLKIQHIIDYGLPEKQAGIMKAMLLGEKSQMNIETKQLYQAGGIGHLFAISGFHVTVLCLFCYTFLQRLHAPPVLSVSIVILVLFGYGEMTGFSVSTNRAVVMMVLLLLSNLLGYSYDLLSALALSAIIILFQNENILLSCSFLLSYGAVLGIYLIRPMINEIVFGTKQIQEKRKRKINQLRDNAFRDIFHSFPRYLLAQIISKIGEVFVVSISVQIMIVPFLLYFYYEIPTYGILINCILMPFSSMLFILGFVATVIGFVSLPLSMFIFGAVYQILCFYDVIIKNIMNLPNSVICVGRPSVHSVIIYYLLLGVGIFLYKKIELQNQRIYLGILACSLLLLCMPDLRIHSSAYFLDVGQGDSIMIRTKKNQWIMVDGGSTTKNNVGQNIILPFMKYYGSRCISQMIMTHEDADHMNGQIELLELAVKKQIKIKHLILPDLPQENKQEAYLQMESLANKAKIPITYIRLGVQWNVGEYSFQCIHPNPETCSDTSNENSITLLVRAYQNSLLLTGDLEGQGEAQTLEYLQNNESLHPESISLLKVAHHGSKNSTSEEFLQTVHPKLAVLSCGKNNLYHHPHKELLDRLSKYHIPVYRTDTNGAVIYDFSSDSLQVKLSED